MTAPLHHRLWTYQAERFPLIKTVPLLAVFSAASLCLSAHLAGRPLPGAAGFTLAFALVFILFFQMRVADEAKDAKDDRLYRPSRPIPRGLVSLKLILTLGALLAPLAALIAYAYHPSVLWLLCLTWLWLIAMSFEFGAPAWLKARPWLYLVSHMAIMPLIDLLLTGVEWGPNGAPAAGLWTFFALSFVNGCVLELGRKLWAPENEIKGVETYSALLGPRLAAKVWLLCLGLALALLLAVGALAGAFWPIALVGFAGFAQACFAGLKYRAAPTPKAEKACDTAAGIWVLLCYGAAGFLPLIWG
ncbi:UbiA family prenyltransferase [Alphaproteobacteria bacterium KMM 3653]|uniref:UbiA family prenyltransferase n=1 Tax=Harenicola maris TaxID=2841044 RepID=A0AAP2CLB1_9RHOB|nr:UbiA family prenyltransferase [Harenicola maris]